MDDLDTPASPLPDNDTWHYNAGADTPEHVGDNDDDADLQQSPKPSDSPEHQEFATKPDNTNERHSASPPPANRQEQVSDNDEKEETNVGDTSPAHSSAAVSSPQRAASRQSDSDAAVAREKSDASDSDDEPIVKKPKRIAVQSDESDVESDARAAKSNDEESDDEPVVKKPKRIALDGDDEDSDKASEKSSQEKEAAEDADEQDVAKLMDDIFGEEDEEEDTSQSQHKRKQEVALSSDDDDEEFRRHNKRGGYSDEEEERPSYRWDFDEIMAKKKAERKHKKRRRGRDGGIDLINDADDQIKTIVDQMTRAAALDRQSNENRQPAFQKHKLLPVVRQTLLKQDLFEALLDNGMMSAVSDWLAPLPDKSLPSLEIRTTLLKILSDYPTLEQGILRQSGLGKAVMYLLKHPRETKENKQRAARLIREWSRPIFQLESDYTSMSREERIELDNLQSRRRRSQDDDSQSASSSRQALQRQPSAEEVLNPAHAGFISRARVPKPSMKAYVHRPKPAIEGQFHGPSKGRSATRFDIAQREFKERTKTKKARRHVAVSIAGNKMEI